MHMYEYSSVMGVLPETRLSLLFLITSVEYLYIVLLLKKLNRTTSVAVILVPVSYFLHLVMYGRCCLTAAV